MDITVSKATESRWTVEAMQRRLAKDPVAVERALVTLFYQQTASEQASGTTVEDNSVGFTGVDAQILSSFAEWVLKSTRAPGQKLTNKQMALAQKKILKYAAQLLRLAGLPVRREKKGTKKVGPILQWDEQVEVTERTQHAWHDGWTVAIPVNLDRLDATDEEIRAEVASHNQSSYGVLRYRTYRFVNRTESGADVLVEVLENLVD
jgi:hypothetical protein